MNCLRLFMIIGLGLMGIGQMATGHAQTVPRLAMPYAPACGSDHACRIWSDFRKQRPFPLQTIAAALTNKGELTIILSEPAPTESKAKLKELVNAVFGNDLLKYSDRRWMIGVDGWLEDVVLTVRWGKRSAPLAGFLSDPLLRDRLSLLHKALYGTA